MTLAPYDIFKKDAAVLLWVEAVQDLELARSRIRDLGRQNHNEYIIFDQKTQRIVDCSNVLEQKRTIEKHSAIGTR